MNSCEAELRCYISGDPVLGHHASRLVQTDRPVNDDPARITHAQLSVVAQTTSPSPGSLQSTQLHTTTVSPPTLPVDRLYRLQLQ